jgi:hypothetical protein
MQNSVPHATHRKEVRCHIPVGSFGSVAQIGRGIHVVNPVW